MKPCVLLAFENLWILHGSGTPSKSAGSATRYSNPQFTTSKIIRRFMQIFKIEAFRSIFRTIEILSPHLLNSSTITPPESTIRLRSRKRLASLRKMLMMTSRQSEATIVPTTLKKVSLIISLSPATLKRKRANLMSRSQRKGGECSKN
jgi:hypothetical protein